MGKGIKRNVLLTIAYDGSGFRGWQVQPGLRTVQGELARALAQLTGGEVELYGTSRTDAGVHALGQCASLRGDFGIPAMRIPIALNHRLMPSGIEIVAAQEKPEGFHARFSATGKTYLYRIRDSAAADIFLRKYRYQLEQTLDIEAMTAAAAHLLGAHDFSAFCASGSSPDVNPVKTLENITISHHPGLAPQSPDSPRNQRHPGLDPQSLHSPREIEIRITGDSFLYNMVRIIVGTLSQVGLGLMDEEDVIRALRSKSRANSGPTAPAGGLWLEEVHYERT